MEKIEYRVRPVTRYIVTRYKCLTDGVTNSPSISEQHGEFDNFETAYAVAYALCSKEHSDLGWPLGDERIQYPKTPENENFVAGSRVEG